MIHMSLPLRARLESRCEVLVTPISISLEAEDRKLLCMTTLRAKEPGYVDAYTSVLKDKLPPFDRQLRDSDLLFIKTVPSLIEGMLAPYVANHAVKTCDCGAYEELSEARMFDLRRIQKGQCVYCGSELSEMVTPVLLADIDWPSMTNFQFSRTWAKTDFERFLERQPRTLKISKCTEPIHFKKENNFGIRYQILWAAMMTYIAFTENDTDITLHYVNRVQDKAFFVATIAKILCPSLCIHFRALPVVWLKDAPAVTECTPSQVKLLGKALDSKRKEVKVSLKSWR